jgi:hypothetical protein
MTVLLGCQKNHTTTSVKEELSESTGQIQTEQNEIEVENGDWQISHEKREFEIQLMASGNYKSIEKEQKSLSQRGFQAKIVPVLHNGQTMYRLRLTERFTYQEAKAMALLLENEVKTIQKVWIQKVL